MTTRRAIPFFLTTQGRNISLAFITGSSIAVTTVKYALHTFGLNYYKDFVQYYEGAKPIAVPKQLQDRFEKCLNILNVSDIHKKLITPFSVFGFDLFNAGTYGSKFGVIVGIPKNFTYQSLEDVARDDIKVNLKSVDFSSEVGKKLSDSLVLPAAVQEFALCREILMGNTYKATFESVYPFACTFVAYTFTQYVNHRMNLYAAPTLVRGCFYSLVAIFTTGVYFLMKDSTEVYYETEVDKQLCKLGPDYIESGVVFYEKLLKRNQALRELMGAEGEKKYSTLGNELFVLRQPRIALVHRKQFFEEQLKASRKHSEQLDDGDSLLIGGQLNV